MKVGKIRIIVLKQAWKLLDTYHSTKTGMKVGKIPIIILKQA